MTQTSTATHKQISVCLTELLCYSTPATHSQQHILITLRYIFRPLPHNTNSNSNTQTNLCHHLTKPSRYSTAATNTTKHLQQQAHLYWSLYTFTPLRYWSNTRNTPLPVSHLHTVTQSKKHTKHTPQHLHTNYSSNTHQHTFTCLGSTSHYTITV